MKEEVPITVEDEERFKERKEAKGKERINRVKLLAIFACKDKPSKACTPDEVNSLFEMFDFLREFVEGGERGSSQKNFADMHTKGTAPAKTGSLSMTPIEQTCDDKRQRMAPAKTCKNCGTEIPSGVFCSSQCIEAWQDNEGTDTVKSSDNISPVTGTSPNRLDEDGGPKRRTEKISEG